jgi:pimeloyl-ACP methyl ester carboxylesterase
MRPLVYLHPAGGVRATKVLEKLKPRQPVFPGFDGTPTLPKLNSRKGLGKWVGEFIDREIGGPCDVMGCSFGGAVALWLAIQRPELVDHLILECPAGLQTIDAKLRADPAEFRKALFVHPEKAIAAPKTKEVEAENRRMLTHYGAEDGRDAELLERISEVKSQTLILHGTEDRIIGRESMQLLKSRLPKSFLVYVWDAAHNIEVDQPERMLGLVEAFLERSDAFVVPRG